MRKIINCFKNLSKKVKRELKKIKLCLSKKI